MEGKFWCFTINNYNDDDIAKIKSYENNYLIFGREVGENGTPHLQGYIEFKTNRKLERLKREFHQTAHLEKRRGKAIEASDYCKKDGNYEEYGEISKPRPN